MLLLNKGSLLNRNENSVVPLYKGNSIQMQDMLHSISRKGVTACRLTDISNLHTNRISAIESEQNCAGTVGIFLSGRDFFVWNHLKRHSPEPYKLLSAYFNFKYIIMITFLNI